MTNQPSSHPNDDPQRPFYAALCALEELQQVYAHLQENAGALGIDPLTLDTSEASGVAAFLHQLSDDLQKRTYHPTLTTEQEERLAVRDGVVKLALQRLLEAAFPPAFPRDPDAEKTIQWLAANIDKGLTRAHALSLNKSRDDARPERLLERAFLRIGDPQLVALIKEILAASPPSHGILASLLADIAFKDIDDILQQAKALGREENFLHVQCTRVCNEVIVLSDRDPRYDWILPAVQKRLREELSNLHYAPEAIATQSFDLTCGEPLRFLDYELCCVRKRSGELRVQYRRVEEPSRPQAADAPAQQRQPGRSRSRSFVPPGWNWLKRRPSWRLGRSVYRNVNAIQIGWRHLPLTLWPILVVLFGWRSPAAWLCLAAILVCNWRWLVRLVRSMAAWAGRHKVDVGMGTCAVSALICLYPVVSDIYAHRSRETAASSFLPPGFYRGEYHGESWWNDEATPAVNYGLYLPPHFQEQKGPFPLIVFLHGYGERTPTLIFKAGIPRSIASRFGADSPNGPFEFVAFFPIDPTGQWQAGSPEVDKVMAALAYVMRRHRIDPSRVYLTGLSNGGSGVWSLAEAYPDRWAAVAPVCSFTSPEVATVRRLPAWIFHGAKDEQANVERERSLVRQLQEAGAEVRYTEYPDKAHLIWKETYDGKELYDWLATKKKG